MALRSSVFLVKALDGAGRYCTCKGVAQQNDVFALLDQLQKDGADIGDIVGLVGGCVANGSELICANIIAAIAQDLREGLDGGGWVPCAREGNNDRFRRHFGFLSRVIGGTRS